MYEVCARTDVGRVRLVNEDGYLINGMAEHSGVHQCLQLERELLVAVADGMGGADAGAVASRLALTECAQIPMSISEEELRQFIEERVHAELLTYGDRHPEAKGMGTTLTGVIGREHRMVVFHIGDSRAYRYRDGFLKQLTTDHTLIESLYQFGQVSRDELATSPNRHILLQCLGGQASDRPVSIDVQRVRGDVAPDDLFLLCTDGLTSMVHHEEIEGVLAEYHDLSVAAERLVSLANERGGVDNVTVVLIRRLTDDVTPY